MIPHNVSCSLSVFQILTLYSSNLLRLGWKPCGDEDESIDHKIHFLVESSINTHLIQTIFFLYLLWDCDATVVVFFHWIYICTCKRFISCLLFWKDLSANISRSPFIKVCVQGSFLWNRRLSSIFKIDPSKIKTQFFLCS